MRTFLLYLACMGCTEHGSSVPITCGPTDCNPDEVCLHQAQGIDAGAGIPPRCVAVPPGCSSGDCSGNCPACIQELCAAPELTPIILEQRVLTCPAQ